MIDGNFFNKLVSIYPVVLFQPVFMLTSQEYIARQVREDDRPFGGIQVIFCGLAFPLLTNIVRKARRLWRLLPAASRRGKKFAHPFRFSGERVVSVFWAPCHTSSSFPSRQPR